jgi:carbamoyl-phosphate synthase large subunit
MVDSTFEGFQSEKFPDLDHALSHSTDSRLFAVGNAMIEQGYSVDKVHSLTKIDKWFLFKLENIVRMRQKILAFKDSGDELNAAVLKRAKQLGFSDKQIGDLTNSSELAVRKTRKQHGIVPFVRRIDTLASEFPAATNYLYTTYNASTHDVKFDENGIVVLGSGVYRKQCRV